MTVKIGTRGSKLALWQAYFIEQKLRSAGLGTEIVIIETKGDKILDRSLSKIGSKGVFTEELEEQLLSGKIDIAVHSAKDLQSDLGENFKILAFTEREKVNDVLVSLISNLKVNTKDKFTVGTSSTRRVAMLRAYYPNVNIVDMRGNLQTRIKKMEDGVCDALLLAYAGIHRMEQESLIVHYFDENQFTPAVGQGTVAVESSVNIDPEKAEIIRNACNHPLTETCLLTERAFLKKLQGGCSIPVFGNARTEENTIVFSAGIISLDGTEIIRETLSGPAESPEALGISTAELVLSKGGDKILEKIKSQL
ncbi:hydroxymethylbilane synthase [Emticicia sp. CRIBPO]|uniref:hydroxymethylbilane synthase n=1 Tax=Emticicia sp. CRIBPO TaxID=2683258 RepID=UPI001413754A|nr:hydroxymethylbilane synthase [Emticicia sp. CRIBPO]NBA88756.1 hydroxymethylbilane synthase [Emticicia sp. CRIBPO]